MFGSGSVRPLQIFMIRLTAVQFEPNFENIPYYLCSSINIRALLYPVLLTYLEGASQLCATSQSLSQKRGTRAQNQ